MAELFNEVLSSDPKTLLACSECHFLMPKKRWNMGKVCLNCESSHSQPLKYAGVVAVMTNDHENSYVTSLLEAHIQVKPRSVGLYAVNLYERQAHDEVDD